MSVRHICRPPNGGRNIWRGFERHSIKRRTNKDCQRFRPQLKHFITESKDQLYSSNDLSVLIKKVLKPENDMHFFHV